jgi:Asp-tRNA(Asn)/Glu-tRNA(Gln) amidotransferase A subunit family amidase
VEIRPESALAAAAESQARGRKGSPLGPIDGVPATVKDNIWAKGLPTRCGAKTTDPSPAVDVPAVARLREQGAVILGKTGMPEHGWIGICHSPRAGVMRNPSSSRPCRSRVPRGQDKSRIQFDMKALRENSSSISGKAAIYCVIVLIKRSDSV